MAIIGEIRKRQWLLLVVILGALAAFILGDAFRNSGGSSEERSVSTIYGDNLSYSDYDKLLAKELAKYQRAYGESYNDDARQGIEESFLDVYLNNLLYQKQYDAIGLTVTAQELNDILQGAHIDPTVYQQSGLFLDASGRFSEDSLRRQLPIILSQSPNFQYYMDDVLGDQAEKERLRKKYTTLISKGLYTTKQESKKAYIEQNTKASFNYVYLPFSSIPDSVVSVTEDDIKKYYDQHKEEKKYEGNDAISFQFVEFPIEFSEDDIEESYSYFDTSMIRRFKEAERDSAFVFTNSDTKDLDFSYKSINDFPVEIDSLIRNADTGDIIGPYRDGDYYKITKLIDVKIPEEAKVRHILLGTNKYGNNLPVLQAKADSIIKVIKAQNNFDAMVKQFSTDPGSIEKGGVYEWFDDKTMVPEFTAVSFNEPIGTITTAVTQYGIHIIEVLGRRRVEGELQYSCATVDYEIRASKETIDNAINKSIDFRNLFETYNVVDTTFINKARKKGFFATPGSDVVLTQKAVPGFEDNPTQIKRWAFNAEKGDISDFMVFDKKVIIAHLTSKSEKGIPAFESVKDDMGYEVIKEKKASIYKEKMKGSTLQEIASVVGLSVQTANAIPLNQNNIPGVGDEPAMIGAAFGVAANSISNVIVGKEGIFVVSPTTVTEASIPEGYNFESEQKSANFSLRGGVDNRVYQTLIEVSEMENMTERNNIIENN